MGCCKSIPVTIPEELYLNTIVKESFQKNFMRVNHIVTFENSQIF